MAEGRVLEEDVTTMFWFSSNRAKLIVNKNGLTYTDTKDDSYSFEIPLSELRHATIRFKSVLIQAVITTRSGSIHKIGLRDREQFERLTAGIEEAVSKA